MTHPFLMVWLLLMIRYEFVYVYFITTKNVGDYSYMSSPNIYYRAANYDILIIRTRRELGSSPKGGDTMRYYEKIQLIIAFLTLVVAVLQLLK